MRISDWSSDVCSSDLLMRLMRAAGAMKGESDYYEYANSAYMKGLPGEAKAVIDEGVAAKVLNPGKQTFAELSKLSGAKIAADKARSEEHTSELQSLMRISYAVF